MRSRGSMRFLYRAIHWLQIGCQNPGKLTVGAYPSDTHALFNFEFFLFVLISEQKQWQAPRRSQECCEHAIIFGPCSQVLANEMESVLAISLRIIFANVICSCEFGSFFLKLIVPIRYKEEEKKSQPNLYVSDFLFIYVFD